MPLTPEQRKEMLGHGGLARVARRARRSRWHVSEVNRLNRFDEKVRGHISREIVEKNPLVDAAEIWPVDERSVDRGQVGAGAMV